MRTYEIHYGAFVRMYAHHMFEAASDKEAKKRYKTEFKKHAAEFEWDEHDRENLALPSVVGMRRYTSHATPELLSGVDFAVSEEDARDLVSREMLQCLEAIETHCQRRHDQGVRRIGEGRALRARIQAVIRKAKEF